MPSSPSPTPSPLPQNPTPESSPDPEDLLDPPSHRPDRASARAIAGVIALVGVKHFLWWWVVGVVGGMHWSVQLVRWDAGWYRDIALGGYNLGWEGKHSNLAFFPAYPLLTRAVADLLPGGVVTALLVVATLGTALALWGLVRLGEELESPRFGHCLALLWAVTPRAYILDMPYSEGLFTAFVVWSLVFLTRGRWWLAALACAAAGLTRPTGSALLAVIGLAFCWLLVTRLRARGPEAPPAPGWCVHPATTPSVATCIGAGLLAASGLFTSFAHVAHRWGSWRGYFEVQASWNMRMGSPTATLQQVARAFDQAQAGTIQPTIMVALVMVPLWTLLLVVSLVLARRRPDWWPVVAMSLGIWLMMVCAQEYFGSKERYLLPAVGLLLPLAQWVSARSTWAERRAAANRRGWLHSQLPFFLAWVVAACLSGAFGLFTLIRGGIAP